MSEATPLTPEREAEIRESANMGDYVGGLVKREDAVDLLDALDAARRDVRELAAAFASAESWLRTVVDTTARTDRAQMFQILNEWKSLLARIRDREAEPGAPEPDMAALIERLAKESVSGVCIQGRPIGSHEWRAAIPWRVEAFGKTLAKALAALDAKVQEAQP